MNVQSLQVMKKGMVINMTKNKYHLYINLLFSVIALSLILLLLLNSTSIWNAFYSTIIVSRAYVGIFVALKVTVLLSIVGVILGTLFGALICAMRMSNIYSVNTLGRILIAVLRGTPVVMLLMFLYFFVFYGNSIDALYVAMLGFGLNTSSHMAEIFRTSIEAINPKELEAARMLGFSKSHAFFRIALPQSWKIAKPVYESCIITLIQWTSVAGYISVTELTRVINGLGTRTGNPVFSLFMGIVIYLGLAYVVRFIFWITSKRGALYDKG
jgi:polar amino acid transport system permease protein/polar amino acid transport system substrate-binding protein